MNHSVKKGFSFGLTSGIITALGLMVGLEATTNSKLAVLGGVIAIAIADAFSDALGIHISEEAEIKHTAGEIWQSTIATFVTKFFFAMTFALPVLLFTLATAVIIGVAWGILVIGAYSIYLAKKQKINPCKVVLEHVGIAILVVIATHYLGKFIQALV